MRVKNNAEEKEVCDILLRFYCPGVFQVIWLDVRDNLYSMYIPLWHEKEPSGLKCIMKVVYVEIAISIIQRPSQKKNHAAVTYATGFLVT